MRISNI